MQLQLKLGANAVASLIRPAADYLPRELTKSPSGRTLAVKAFKEVFLACAMRHPGAILPYTSPRRPFRKPHPPA